MTASSFPSSERYGGYLSADHKIFGDQMVLYADGYYENVKTHNEAAPPATGNFQTKGQTTLAIPPHSPLGLGSHRPILRPLTRLVFRRMRSIPLILSSKSSRALPALACLTLGIGYSTMRLMPWLTTLGVKGDKLFDGSWGYDAGWRYSQLKNVQTGQQVSASRFNRDLERSRSYL